MSEFINSQDNHDNTCEKIMEAYLNCQSYTPDDLNSKCEDIRKQFHEKCNKLETIQEETDADVKEDNKAIETTLNTVEEAKK